ncbi:outer membrane beta-barrel protein [Capnocytophaga catalasegens]|uniref:Outer membrane protein beta-barrel domain-containing protein n=1 Tax=Capnocytophaga catalasegens TaxID=1004260 RepID=A0AAV5ANX2_9FLAO|nr:outer membrane beta-barrel protein [Capnocytophaga catalasegens]GIZ14052.1 hypothetical protein RCZ03_00530 [Capnocytophaga catalasegens]GJM49049.1 hypothetical protein RCZ15_00250 [Capnocytophaga catalasegens]GJM52310.1 hypothetical protein RCZ16_06280 [Capnocytophaga catalasegens]
MKKILVAIAFLATTMMVQAQFYVSASGGYAWGVPSIKIGEENIKGNQKVNFGTYGEGFNTQLRLGYFFNKTWGVDISGGYLHGADQSVRKEVATKNLANTPLTATVNGDVKARGRAYGLALSVIYNFTDNFYGRFGILTKVGGKTEAIAYSTTVTDQDIPLAALASLGAELPSSLATNIANLLANGYTHIQKGAKIETSYTEDFKGKMPFGTIAALGYKYNFSPKVAIFAEVEYMNISVKRDYSQLQHFEQTLESIFINPANASLPAYSITMPYKKLSEFTDGVYRDALRDQTYLARTTYVDELPASNTDITKKITEKVSYSSLGINVGITYTF